MARVKSNFVTQFSAWLSSPSEVASVCPSTRVLTRSLAKQVNFSEVETLVELGPGTGETSREFLSRMNPGAKLLAIERNQHLAKKLSETSDDERLSALDGDAVDLMEHLEQFGASKPQAIVSGIPFSTIEPEKSRRILKAIDEALLPGGSFIAYQLRESVAKYATPHFGEPKTAWVWWNFPPLKIFVWKKPNSG